MAHRVFFSFHYERDIWRASVVRNSWVTQPDAQAAGFWDAASWEEVQKKGEEEIKRWIRKQLEYTTVTAVLIGPETFSRKYVQYEIKTSLERGNGLFGIFIHQIKGEDGKTEPKGASPFVVADISGVAMYDWIADKGYENIGTWVEKAYKEAKKGLWN